ncbi:Protein LONGIFOLIA 1 [Cardamine amara subsp. amara]|uniref:Protein LONGIFOLIA 1 n=1 Tax=Cardamine amara subsp. amara TaxID=228776 RepID=A0ABD1AAX9_CARAN
MGRDWSWLGGGKKKSSIKSNKEDIKTTPSLAGNTTTAAGCMSAVFNIFDSHNLQLPINHHHLHLPKGVDAPRNSLESTEEETPFSPTRKDGNLNISMGIKIKTKPQARTSTSYSSSHTATESYSPSIKTPTLVARLMGLDLVPDNYISSPTPSSSSSLIDLKTATRSSHTNKHRHYSLQRNSVDGGTRSLPETPRISLGRRSVDVNCYEHQRSSLHLRDNNNNNNVLSERESGSNNVRFTRVKEMKIHEDKENRSPREYARQIVMQLKENVNRRRRMGTDITNKEQQSREIHESNKSASKITIITHNSSSSSPRLGLTDIPKTKPQTNNVAFKIPETTVKKVQDKTRLPTVQEEPQGSDKPKQRKIAKKCKKPENFKSRLVKPPQSMQEEPFVKSPATSNNSNGLLLIQGEKSSSKKTHLSIKDLTNFTSVPSLHNTIKKIDSSPHHKSSNIKLRETQSPRNRATTEFPSFPSQSQTNIAPIAGGELEYITRTLRRTGIDRDTPISYAKWFSPSHPLDPSIFYFLEHFAVTSTRPRNSPENLALRCNRKLLFHLVDEILADILKPHINLKPWVCRHSIQSQRNLKGSELIDELSRKIERFPLAECLVLEDIDALVAGDMPETESAFEEDGEGIVTEIERGILETLVTETTTDYYATWIKTAPLKRNDDVSGTWGVHVTRYSSNVGSHHDSSSSLLCERRLMLPRG